MLYVISTPIGNLKDLSLRAQETLRDVDLIASEDTRRTGKLLKHLELKKKQISFHEHNRSSKTPYLIELMKEGQKIGLVSDSGTPTISDPGNYLIQKCHKEQIPVSPIPGPCAAIAALSISGLPTDRFSFYGFIPKTSGRKQTFLESFKDRQDTIICYESPYRIQKTLTVISKILPNWKIFLARELTKRFEETAYGSAEELLTKQISKKGEFVIILHSKGYHL